ncbi:MAG: glycoside hydrolase family 15 protein [Candidatus Competibacteraceae bacterium]|nr:glycoside hydrolase family 15 protein [Candidatus Competibacteraceae bacterium]
MADPSVADHNRYPPIGDYAIIGDCRCAALISRDGSLDWLCLPRFDSPAVFSALLDDLCGGRFRIRPSGDYRVERRYLGDSNILETTFHTAGGVLRLTDLMPIYTRDDRRRELCPERQVLRAVECLEGAVEVEILYRPRFDYGQISVHIQDRKAMGLYCSHREHALILRSELALELPADGAEALGRHMLAPGRRYFLAMAYEHDDPLVVPVLGQYAEGLLERTRRWWEDWVAHCCYQGPYRAEVIRSILVLKLMTFAPSGSLVAAPTTSLPEQLGGTLNWDYRFCWLRDASMTLRAFLRLGYGDEARSFLSWLLHTTRMSWPQLQVLYDVYGETELHEYVLKHLEGYRRSWPVRAGNDAHGQLQMDLYGEVLSATYDYLRDGDGPLDHQTASLLRGLGETVCRCWEQPDEGIWEIRAGRRHNTHSKVMCWVALDRLVHLHQAGRLEVPLKRFTQVREVIRQTIEDQGWDEAQRSYIGAFGRPDILDAALLLMPVYGYQQSDSPRMRDTCRRILARLGRGPLIYRYTIEGGELPPEGAFGACCFWAVQCQVLEGQVESARASFEQLLGYTNDVGLYAEMMDGTSGAHLGNFPQAYTHVGLINAALALEEAGRDGGGE